jgi:hypothetical protein
MLKFWDLKYLTAWLSGMALEIMSEDHICNVIMFETHEHTGQWDT